MRTRFAPVLPVSAVLAIAAGCGTTAHAQSSVQVYGLLDLSIGYYHDSGSLGRTTQLASGKLTTSYLGFRGVEDLGGGLSAFYVLESHLRVDTGEVGRSAADPYFSRNAFVGVGSNTYGSVSLGRASTPLWISALASNPFVGSTGFSPSLRLLFGPTGKTGGDGVWSNSIIYTTPKLGGFTASVQHQLKEAAQGGNTGGNVLYTNGALSLTAAAQSVEAPFVSGKETTGLVGGSYDFGPLRMFAQYAQVREGATRTPTANTRDKIYQVGATIPVGAANVLVSYGDAKTTGAVPGQRQFFSLGYDYRLSKRTDLYTVAMLDKFNTAGRTNSFAVGVRHTF